MKRQSEDVKLTVDFIKTFIEDYEKEITEIKDKTPDHKFIEERNKFILKKVSEEYEENDVELIKKAIIYVF